jgi:KaiC/GvpD/RAD55 family RecA-like ATPase
LLLGGGLREGSVVVMTGDPKSGKTTTAFILLLSAKQRGKRVIYLDTEGRMSEQNFDWDSKVLIQIRILVIQSTNDRILSAEDFLNIVEYYINNDPGLFNYYRFIVKHGSSV